MNDDERMRAVRELLASYVKSPSLRHIRDPHSLDRLSREIVSAFNRGNSVWQKWDGQRELFLRSAIGCWIPTLDLREFLNTLPGPKLTTTDVAQRLLALEDDGHFPYPKKELEDGCLAIYQHERAEGTELPAIIGLLRSHVEQEEERLRKDNKVRYLRIQEADRIAREQRLLSGADCGWTQLPGTTNMHCRANGRTFRLCPGKDKRWQLFRVRDVDDDEPGIPIGTYAGRREATGVVAKLAYQPEPRG